MQLPDFTDPANRATFERGNVPPIGWYLIEPPYRNESPKPDCLAEALGCDPSDCPDEGASLDDLAILAGNFEQGDPKGRGILITADHSGIGIMPSTRACGWIRALETDSQGLWGCIDWTPYGHDMVNNGEYAYFSTEYDYKDFIQLPEGYATPRVLAACTLTNEPRHAGQKHATNSKTPLHNMDPDKEQDPDKAANSDADKQEDKATNMADEQQEDKATNSDPVSAELGEDKNKDDKATNDELEDQLAAIADELELPETATLADMAAAVKSLKQSNKELAEALEAANQDAQAASGGTATNSRSRYPNLMRATNSRSPQRLRGGKPNGTVNVRCGNVDRAVNSQQHDMVTHINAKIKDDETRLGRSMSSGEYSKAYARHLANYRTKH
ncbi:MAG: phage protease [Akkermansia sp.]